jgi:hypothetical protein
MKKHTNLMYELHVEKESKKESLIVWVAVIAIVLGLIIGVVETLNYFA